MVLLLALFIVGISCMEVKLKKHGNISYINVDVKEMNDFDDWMPDLYIPIHQLNGVHVF